MSFVYWLRLPEMADPKTEGYVGVSNNPKSRFYAHKYVPPNERMREAVSGQRNRIVMDIILESDRLTCCKMEHNLRQTRNIGWNVVQGGTGLHSGPAGKSYYQGLYKKEAA